MSFFLSLPPLKQLINLSSLLSRSTSQDGQVYTITVPYTTTIPPGTVVTGSSASGARNSGGTNIGAIVGGVVGGRSFFLSCFRLAVIGLLYTFVQLSSHFFLKKPSFTFSLSRSSRLNNPRSPALFLLTQM